MVQEELIAILKRHKLRITECRLVTLAYLLEAGHAVSARTLEEVFPQFDRVTMYRTISSFEETGILHSIPDDSGVARYGICHDTCAPGHHRHDHIHFKCKNCGNIECIDSIIPFQPRLQGYLIENMEVIVSGTCKSCTGSEN